jgi:hypothetical protein
VFLNDHVKLVLAGCENLATVVKRSRVLLDQKGEASEVGLLLRSLDNQTKEIETQVGIHTNRFLLDLQSPSRQPSDSYPHLFLANPDQV